MIDTNFFVEAEKNNTFDYRALCETLNLLKESSYNFLYGLQADLTGITRFDFNSSDLKKKNKSLYYYTIEFGFIDEPHRKRFYKSQYWNKRIKLSEISSNTDYFNNTFLCFIDGFLVDNIEIQAEEDKTIIWFPIRSKKTDGISIDLFNKVRDNSQNISILFLPNHKAYTHTTNKYMLQRTKNDISLSSLSPDINNNTKVITFVNADKDKSVSGFMGANIDDGEISVDSSIFDIIDSTSIKLNVFCFRHLRSIITLSGEDKFFMANTENMPVPTTNFIIFRNVNGISTFAYDLSLKLYYPNIYEVVGNDNNDELTICEFYFEDMRTLVKYKNDLELYYKYNGDVLEKFKNGTIPELVKYYKPQEFNFSIPDFEKYDKYRDDFKYRVDKLKEWIAKDNDLVRPYLMKQIATNESNFIYVMNLDLEDRLRLNNYDETDDVDKQVVFPKETYLFTVRNKFIKGNYSLRFFVDGKLSVPVYVFSDELYLYYYLPTEDIKDDSVIEVERFDEFYFEDEFIPTEEMPYHDISIKCNNMRIYANDVFITHEDTTYIDNIDNSAFYLKVNIHGLDVQLDSDSFYVTSDSRLVITDKNLYGKKIKIWVKNLSYYESQETTYKHYLDSITFNFETSNDPRFFRVFRNGFLLPSHIYNIDFKYKMNEKSAVSVNMGRQIGDIYTIDSTPYKYKDVYYKNKIDERGYVDLSGIISRPIDLKWYDVYLNGRRLRPDQLEVISATKFFLVNVGNTIHLNIYQKDRDEEYFTIGGSTSPIESMLEGIDGFFQDIYESHESLTDIYDDILNSLVDNFEVDLVNFFHLYMRGILINPDLDQITDEMKRKFPSLFTLEEPFFINPDDNPDAQSVLHMNPDIIAE